LKLLFAHSFNDYTDADPCLDAGCSNDCEVDGGKAVCTCPEDMVLGDDAKTCTSKQWHIVIVSYKDICCL
jgi:hypothetical protein